jgi:hypothetical protein
MGGYMRVVIRDEDGSVWSNQRHTNAMTTFTRDARFVDNDEAWFDRYKGHGQFHTDDHTLAPIEYGILVVDRKTMTVIDHNDFAAALEIGIVNLYNSPDDPEYLELLRRGLLRYEGAVLAVPEGMTLEKHALELYRKDDWGKVEIDCKPWTYVKLRDVGHDDVRRRMKELGFEFTPRDEAAFDHFIRDRAEDDVEDVDTVLAGIPKTAVDIARDEVSTVPVPTPDPEACTYTIDVWQDESIWTWEGVASSEAEAEEAAVEQLNQDWERDYADMAAMRADMDGVALIRHPAVMADREPLARFEAKRDLADLVRNMLGDDRLAGLGPDDRQALSDLVDAARAN